MAGLPTLAYTEHMAQYVCELCKEPILDISVGTYHYVKAWVKTGSNANPRHVEKLFMYAHAVCTELSKPELIKSTQGTSLFD